ncbi:hypothetical protein GN244_ATG02092 [Phytophthora infestans]|uniref:Uncharacterized protein n=1 Tax=Phytophthora infestans TaxID=4787 RepID=A0A833TD03_PHYIN|nr:hypothetical protein GN244_ATG02092 [Phytophthora infestans]
MLNSKPYLSRLPVEDEGCGYQISDVTERNVSLHGMRNGPVVMETGAPPRYMTFGDSMKEILWMRLLLKDIDLRSQLRSYGIGEEYGYQTPNEHTIFASILFGTCGDVELKYVDTKNQLTNYLTKDSST